MNKQQQEDLERTNELLQNIWSIVIKNTYNNVPNPDQVTIDQIESNQGRIKKALRLLEGSHNIKYCGIRKTPTIGGYKDREDKIYKVYNLDLSSTHCDKPEFISDIRMVHDELFPNVPDNQFTMDILCYREIRSLTPKEILYVYWNEKEFHFVQDKKQLWIYPIALQDIRMKAIMRSIIEQYFHSFFHNRIEEYLGLKEGSIKKNDSYSPKIRNFAAHGHRFDMEKFYGKNGFMEEYTHFRDYFQALIDQMTMFQSYINNAGGHAAVIEKYRKDIITLLLKKAPLSAFTPLQEKKSLAEKIASIGEAIEEQFKNPYLNTFILRNAQFLNYNLLYPCDDKKILFINEKNQCRGHVSLSGDTTFNPNQDELDLIAGKA